MGLLEEAIREHLELKRKHGADPSDVARQEREALSPATRDPGAAAEAVGLDGPAAQAEALADPATAPGEPAVPELTAPPAEGFFDFEAADATQVAPRPDAEGEASPSVAPHDVPEAAAPPEAAPHDLPEAASPDAGDQAAPAHADEPPASLPDDPPAPAEPPHQPTAAFDAEELFADEDSSARAEREETRQPPAPAEPSPKTDGESHDVLEETPDFLEETPDHDRLWFEQKPPRDFDF